MKTLLTVILAALTFSATANDFPPEFLKDGTITIALKNGKTYTFSTNTHMVVKRGVKKLPQENGVIVTKIVKEEKTADGGKRLRHIVSGEVLRSNRSLSTSVSANEVEVRNQKELGLGVQYQYNFHGDLFLGGRVDTNGGAGLSLGVGF